MYDGNMDVLRQLPMQYFKFKIKRLLMMVVDENCKEMIDIRHPFTHTYTKLLRLVSRDDVRITHVVIE